MTTPRGMTPEELKEARDFIERWINANTSEYPSPPAAQYRLLARYCRELERHAEAMADAIGKTKVTEIPRDVAMAFADYRAFTTPEPRRT